MTAALLGIDIGTSGCKALLLAADGGVIATDTASYPLSRPRPGWTEQDPALWIEGVRASVAGALAKAGPVEVLAIGLSGQMHGLTPLDASHRVLRPAILWNDQRNGAECDAMTEMAGGLPALLAGTNNRMLPGYTGGKIIWLRDEEPENFEKMDVFVCPKDYIRYLLTGELATEVSDGSGTGFFDTKNRRWSDKLIAKCGLDKAIFPTALESTDRAGKVTRQAAEETGLPEGIPVFAGGGDAVIQTTGAGLVKPGILGVVVGTAGNVAMGMDGYCDNPEGKLQMFCNNAPHLWHALGCTLAAGGSLRWYRDALGEDAVRQAKDLHRPTYA